MVHIFPNETFIEIASEYQFKLRYAISNYGRLISFTDQFKDGRLLKGSLNQGFRAFCFKTVIDGKKVNKLYFFYNLVGQYHLTRPNDDAKYIIHLDHNKLNDHVSNLKWVTQQERVKHYKTSPAVIAAREKLIAHNKQRDGLKLTETRVKLIKRKLADPNRKTRLKVLAKQFGISEMQLYRIKSGENWGHVTPD
ncbi:MAG: hypothetical protein K0S26_843 [Bacteroidota bacterium]|jgi:hypothetical protein|nr:hypothetical protein [Bacteroidota bacterium]